MGENRKLDKFEGLAIRVIEEAGLIEGLFDFLDLAKENGIAVNEKILFIGKYQQLLFESVILSISYILFDSYKAKKPARMWKRKSKSRMQFELDKTVEKLKKDIVSGKDCSNGTSLMEAKKAMLDEIEKMRKCKNYKKSISSIKTIRNKRVAHIEDGFELSKDDPIYEKIKIVVENITRCCEIRARVFYNEIIKINSYATYSHSNMVQALVLKEELEIIRNKYNEEEAISKGEWHSNTLDFWNEKIKPYVFERMQNEG